MVIKAGTSGVGSGTRFLLGLIPEKDQERVAHAVLLSGTEPPTGKLASESPSPLTYSKASI